MKRVVNIKKGQILDEDDYDLNYLVYDLISKDEYGWVAKDNYKITILIERKGEVEKE